MLINSVYYQMVENKNNISFEDIIPEFVPSHSEENSRYVEWSNYGIIGYVNGTTISLAYQDPNNPKLLKRICPIEVAPYDVSCFKFHPTEKKVAIGDVKGRIFIWDIDERQYKAGAKPLIHNTGVLDLAWDGPSLLVLLTNQRLYEVFLEDGYRFDEYYNIRIDWDISISDKYTHIEIDPIQQQYLLLYGPLNHFCIMRFLPEHFLIDPSISSSTSDFSLKDFSLFDKKDQKKKEQKKKRTAETEITTLFESVELTNTSSTIVRDAQWHIHIPGYIYLVFDNSVLFFDIFSHSLIPIINTLASTSSFSSIVQFFEDHSRFLTIQRNGNLCLYRSFKKSDFSHFLFQFELQSKQTTCQFIGAAVSPYTDQWIAASHPILGLCLLNSETNQVVSMEPSLPSNSTAVDCDAFHYVLGTSNGFIIIGDLRNPSPDKTLRFQVCNQPLIFISIQHSTQNSEVSQFSDNSESSKISPNYEFSQNSNDFNDQKLLIWWATRFEIGSLDIITRKIWRAKKRTIESLKWFKGMNGCAIVQRTPSSLGVFINEEEKPLLLNSEIVDVCPGEDNNLIILLKNQQIHFFKYLGSDGFVQTSGGLKPKIPESEPLCIASKNEKIATGFLNGLVQIFDRDTRQAKKFYLIAMNPIELRFGNKHLFGKSSTNSLFLLREGESEFNICPKEIRFFAPLSDDLVLIQGSDGVTKFLRTSDWRALSYITKYLPAPSLPLVLPIIRDIS